MGPISRRGMLAAAATVGLLTVVADVPAARAKAWCPDSERTWRPCEVVTSSYGFVVLRLDPDGEPDTIAIESAHLRNAAHGLRQPKRALVDFREAEGRKVLTALGVRVGRWRRFGVAIGVAGILLALAERWALPGSPDLPDGGLPS